MAHRKGIFGMIRAAFSDLSQDDCPTQAAARSYLHRLLPPAAAGAHHRAGELHLRPGRCPARDSGTAAGPDRPRGRRRPGRRRLPVPPRPFRGAAPGHQPRRLAGGVHRALCGDLPLPPGCEGAGSGRAGRGAGDRVLFEAGKFGIGFYLGKSNPGEAFGAAGSLALVLVWIYYSSMLILFGAEFTQVWATERGRGIRPEAGAVHVVEVTREVPADRS